MGWKERSIQCLGFVIIAMAVFLLTVVLVQNGLNAHHLENQRKCPASAYANVKCFAKHCSAGEVRQARSREELWRCHWRPAINRWLLGFVHQLLPNDTLNFDGNFVVSPLKLLQLWIVLIVISVPFFLHRTFTVLLFGKDVPN